MKYKRLLLQTRFFQRLMLWMGLILWIGASQLTRAANVLIWPIDPLLRANQTATELWIENKDLTAITMQVRIIRWQQLNGDENYSSQQDIVASPPIVRIEAGKKQLIRIIKQTPVPSDQELAYRILVDEIFTTDTLAPAKSTQANIKIQVRYSFPLFVYGALTSEENSAESFPALSKEQLSWRLIKLNHKPAIEIINSGAMHARLSHVSVQQTGHDHALANGLFGYVLAYSSRIWSLPKSMAHPNKLNAQVNSNKKLWQIKATSAFTP